MDERSERAYGELKRMLVEGQFAMGESLREAQLAEHLNLSRTPIRHALNRLEAEQLAEYQPGRGHRVRLFTTRDVEEIYSVRALVEAQAVRLAAGRGMPPDKQQLLIELVEQMGRLLKHDQELTPAEVRARFLRLNHRFHAVLYEACGNNHLLTVIRSVTDLPLVMRHYFNFSDEQLRESHRDHKAMLRTVFNKEPERAAAQMSEHILAARDRMLVDQSDSRDAASLIDHGEESWSSLLARRDG